MEKEQAKVNTGDNRVVRTKTLKVKKVEQQNALRIYNPDDIFSKEHLFPVEVFPSWAKNYIREVSDNLQISSDFCSLSFLGTISGLLTGRVNVFVHDSYGESIALWVLSCMKTGERKGDPFKKITKPLEDYNKRVIEQSIRESQDAKFRLQQLKAEEKKLKAKKNRTPKEDSRLQELEQEIFYSAVPNKKKLISKNATPEAIVQQLLLNDERLVLMDSEGAQLKICLGRYTNGEAHFEPLLNAFSGESITRDRTNQESIVIHNPSLTFISTPQPQVIRDMGKNASSEETGFAPRFIYGFPPSMVGGRIAERDPVDWGLQRDYLYACSRIADQNFKYPVNLRFSQEAKDYFFDRVDSIEELIAPSRHDINNKSWYCKYPSFFLRLAGIMHVIHNHDRDWWDIPIELISVRQADRILQDFAVPNATIAYELMGNKGVSKHDRLQLVKEWLVQKKYTQNDTFLVGEMFASIRRRLNPIQALYDSLEDLATAEMLEIEYSAKSVKRIPHRVKLLRNPEDF